jgi:hypothetical protein
MDLEVICGCCNKPMRLNQYDPDQDVVYVEFACDECGSSLSGTFVQGSEKEEA